MKKLITSIAAVALLSAVATNAGIILDNVDSSIQVASGGGSSFTVSGFDAAGSDKLVVSIVGESNGDPRLVETVTYNGAALTLAGSFSDTGLNLQVVSFFYMDSPLASGDLEIDWDGNVNGSGIGLYALSGTVAGGPDAFLGADGSSVSLTTGSDNAFIASAFVSNSGGSPVADAPMTSLYDNQAVGSASSAAGYVLDAGAAGSNVLSYSNAHTSRPAVAAVSFAAVTVPEPATLGLLGAAFGILAFVKRRK